jgi:phosphohistidine phosphatase
MPRIERRTSHGGGMQLLLIQHGDALDESIDPQRPLSARGHDDVERMAEFLARAGASVQRVCESGKLRARQTAEIAAARLAPGVAIETVRGLNPNDAVEPWVEIVNGGSADTLLVGHMPFLVRLVARLLASGVPACVTFTPGSLACLQRRGDAWSLEWMLRPELLR